MENKPKVKRPVFEDVDPTPYRKMSLKTTKKSNHKHEYEPCILKYYSRYKDFNREQGFLGGIDFCPGRKCKHCGRLLWGFPPESKEEKELRKGHNFFLYRPYDGFLADFGYLPQIEVEDIYKLPKF